MTVSRAEHGTRTRYVAGCRCVECKAANRNYSRERESLLKELVRKVHRRKVEPAPQVWTAPSGEKAVRQYKRACRGKDHKGCPWGSHLRKDSQGDLCSNCRQGLLRPLTRTGAKKARAHLEELRKLGVGLRTMVDLSKVSRSALQRITSGEHRRISRDTETAILAVPLEAPVNDTTLWPAEPTWRLIHEMVNRGLTLAEIAHRIGQKKSPGIQVRVDFVRAPTAMRVYRAFNELLEELEIEEPELTTCLECNLSHRKEDRLTSMRRMLPCTFKEIAEEYPCRYPGAIEQGNKLVSQAGARKLYRDLIALGAQHKGGLWYLEEGPNSETVAG